MNEASRRRAEGRAAGEKHRLRDTLTAYGSRCTIDPVLRAVAVVNPVAGRARGATLRAEAVTELRRLFPDIGFVESNAPGHAIELAREARDAELVIAVGGDGTVREVASGLVSTTGPLDHLTTRPPPLLAVIPVGSGNDLLKTIGIPTEIPEACRIAKEGQPRAIDVVRVEMSGEQPSQQDFFVNAAGFGFDAQVVAETRKVKRLRGLPLYVVAVFRAVASCQSPLVRIRCEGFEQEQRVLMVAATNGRYYGGGMKIAPEARLDDGLLEICVIDAVGRFTVIRRLPRFVAGTHTTLKEVRMLRSRWLELEFLEPAAAQLDGDLVADPPRRFSLSVLPAAIRVRTGTGAG